MDDRPMLHRLAHRLGLEPGYHDILEGREHRTPDDTYRRLLTALGHDPDDTRALEDALHQAANRPLPEPVTELPCPPIEERIPSGRAVGLAVNLYSLGGRHNWGVGDLGDLRRLAASAAARGADFILLSPLHVTRGRGSSISPYSPISRLFHQPLYLEVEGFPELAEDETVARFVDSSTTREQLRRLRTARTIDWDVVSDLKHEVFVLAHRAFVRLHRDRDTARGRAYRAFLQRGGTLLERFARFQALDAHLATGSWRTWPAELRDPTRTEVDEWAAAHAEEIDYHRFLQFELDRQLTIVADTARRAGMRIGPIADLALGTADHGFDPWAFPGLFVPGVDLGAPPDPLGPDGQNWAFPPLDPHALAGSDFAYWRILLENAVRHAGGVRIDHVLGLIRQFWIPGGASAVSGAYYRQPTAALFSVLADVCQHHGAVAIGEDLGTVPAEMPATLARWNVHSTRVLLFERGENDGPFHPAAHWPRRALATLTTHDLPTLAALWSGTDLDLRHTLGLLDDDQLAAARRARETTRERLVERLRTDGLLTTDGQPPLDQLTIAAHAFVARTPSALAAVWIDDLALELRPVNLPGVGADRYPSWTRRLTDDATQILDSAQGRATLQAMTSIRPH